MPTPLPPPATADASPAAPAAPLPPRTADEFRLASKMLEGLARDSALFPPRATRMSWFRPRDAADGGEDGPPAAADGSDGTTFDLDDADRRAPVPSVHEREVEAGPLLGAGGFCEVRRATLGRRQYAMKYLSPSKANKNGGFGRDIADLAIEARFLSLLSHENIIRLHYVGEGDLAAQFNCGQDQDQDDASGYRHRFGYFLLLDPLHETLEARIGGSYLPEVFRAGRAAASFAGRSPGGGWWKRIKGRRHAGLPINAWRTQLADRLEDLRGVASALRHLHDDRRVVYRDVKPENIGFYRDPSRGGADVPKLFDFGLAAELKPRLLRSHPSGDLPSGCDTYKLTAKAGSRRYMAPEVAFSEPYNERADVYSFGIVLYQVASLLVPFEGYSTLRHEEEVLGRGRRPDLKVPSGRKALAKVREGLGETHDEWLAREDEERPEDRRNRLAARTMLAWTRGLRSLVEECWRRDFRRRPGMGDVEKRLGQCVEELRGLATRPGGQAEGKAEEALGKSSQSLWQGTQGTESCQSIWQGESMYGGTLTQ